MTRFWASVLTDHSLPDQAPFWYWPQGYEPHFSGERVRQIVAALVPADTTSGAIDKLREAFPGCELDFVSPKSPGWWPDPSLYPV